MFRFPAWTAHSLADQRASRFLFCQVDQRSADKVSRRRSTLRNSELTHPRRLSERLRQPVLGCRELLYILGRHILKIKHESQSGNGVLVRQL